MRVTVVSAALLPLLVTAANDAAISGPLIVEEVARLDSPDPAVPLGSRIAIHGNRMVAGAARLIGGEHRCTAFLFERPSATGAFTFVRTLRDVMVSDDRSGCHLGVDVTDVAAVVSNVETGVGVFELSGASWIETRLAAPSGADDFGSDVAASGGIIVVGGSNDGIATAYIYRRSAPGQWAFEATLVGGTLSEFDNDFLGQQVAADGDYAGIGNPGNDFDGPGATGKLYVFRRTGSGQWTRVALEDASNPALGAAVEASVLQLEPARGAGAFTDGRFPGGANVFVEDSPGNWGAFDHIRPLDAFMNRVEFFGNLFFDDVNNVQLNARPAPVSLAIGVASDEDRGVASGSVTVFTPQVGFGVFTPVVKFLASNAQPGLGLGAAMDYHGDTLVTFGGGRIYVFRLPTSTAQPSLFQDDFTDGNANGWSPSSANWSVLTSQGSRIYRQGSTSGEHWSTRALSWTNVAIEADVRPLAFNGSDRWVSLMTRHRDTQNYYYVALRNTNVLRLARRVGNSFTTLASTSLPVTTNRTYRVRLEAIGTWLRVYVDGVLRLQARDTTHRQGGVGFKTAFARAEFDNVIVGPDPSLTLLASDFEVPLFRNPLAEWTPASGSWSNVASGGGRVLRQSNVTGPARALSGVEYDAAQPEIADQIIQVRARAISWGSASNPWFGVIARFRDTSNYTFVTVNRTGKILLRKLVNNASLILDQAPMTVTTGTWYALRLETVDDLLRVYVNGRLVLEARDADIDPSNTRGRFGLMTRDAAAEYDDFRASQP